MEKKNATKLPSQSKTTKNNKNLAKTTPLMVMQLANKKREPIKL